MAFVEAGGSRLEYEWVGVGPADGPTVVMLHEGLGSVAMWRDFPMQVARATGLRVLVYSRRGYGKSDPVADLPLPFDRGLYALLGTCRIPFDFVDVFAFLGFPFRRARTSLSGVAPLKRGSAGSSGLLLTPALPKNARCGR